MQVFDIPIDEDQKETTPHGTLDFPVAVYHSVLSKNVLGYTNWHWHEELQFCLVTHGSVSFVVNQNTYHLLAGEGIFINRDELHMAKPGAVPDSAYICLDFHDRMLRFFDGSLMGRRYVQPYTERSSLSALPLSPSCAWQKTVLDLIRSVYERMERPDYGWEYDVSAAIASIWCRIIRHCPRPVRKSPVQTQAMLRLQKIFSYIRQHYSENLTLKQIAGSVSLSSSECCRFFKQATGETVFSYLRNVRLSRGMELLSRTDAPVSEIAYACGFCSTSYFIEVFRTYMGTTPLKYRRGEAT